MKLAIEPTSIIETIEGVPCRRWEGVTDAGTPVHVWVRMLSPQTHDPAALEAFDRELRALPQKDCISALQFYFSRRVTDDEMRFLHEVMQRAVAMMPKAPETAAVQ